MSAMAINEDVPPPGGARSVRHFLEVLDELNRLNIEFVSFREQLDTGGPLGRAVIVIISVVAELERNLIVERVRAGMRRARLEGQHIGRRPVDIDRQAVLRDRERGLSLRDLAKAHRVSRTTIGRVLKEAGGNGHEEETVAIARPPAVCGSEQLSTGMGERGPYDDHVA